MVNTPIRYTLIFVLGLMAACSSITSTEPEDPKEPVVTTGTLEVSVTTTGDTQDEDGYTVIVDGSGSKSVPTDSTIAFTALKKGAYQVKLSGVAGNCAIGGDHPLRVTVTAENTTTVSLQVTCS